VVRTLAFVIVRRVLGGADGAGESSIEIPEDRARVPQARRPSVGDVGAQNPAQCLVSAVIDGEAPAIGRLSDRGANALAGALGAGVGKRWKIQLGGRPVQGAGDVMVLCAGEIVQVPGSASEVQIGSPSGA
jgi:hypothetical protein